jgi:serine/threonine-protein kinase
VPQIMTEPLRIRPGSNHRGTALVVLFVLLTVAAVVVMVFVLRTITATRPVENPQSLGATTGTVSSREGAIALSAVFNGPGAGTTVTGSSR